MTCPVRWCEPRLRHQYSLLRETTLLVSRGPAAELLLIALSESAFAAADMNVNPFDYGPNNIQSVQACINGKFFPPEPYHVPPTSSFPTKLTETRLLDGICPSRRNSASFREDDPGG